VGPARPGGSRAEPDRPDRRCSPVVLAKLGSTRGIAGEARSGNLGCARGAAGCTGADVGLARCTARAGRHARGCAYLGFASATRRRPPAAGTRAELGCTGAGSFSTISATSRSGTGVGRVGRTRTFMGFAAAAGCARASPAGAGARTARTARTTSCPAGRCALMERISCGGSGSSSTSVGNACRLVSIAHPDRAVMEPSGSSLECAGAARLNTGSTLFHRLGCPSARVRGATTDRCTFVERTRGRGLGRPEDRGARGSRRALMVGPGSTGRRAGGRGPTV
jgi:hypothetical protein